MVSLATVDALARLQLAAKRRGLQLRLPGPQRELHELIELAGLTGVLGVEPRREAEEREERLGVEEEGELGDAIV
jgi:anti-anti-sigma regulatory factor